MPGISIPALSAALSAIGNAHVFLGDPFTAGGLVAIGAKEGAINFEPSAKYSDLTAEQTGDVVHQRTVMGVSARITVPVVLGDSTLYAKISPTGTSSGGWDTPQAVVPTSLLLIPDSEVAGGLANATGATSGWVRTAGNGYAGASGAGAAPVHAVWLWRCVPELTARPFSYENGGKIVTEIPFQAMFYATSPAGHKVWTVGDPAAQGITTIRI
jgi:hypothetical protein